MQRMTIVHAFFLIILLTIIARLLELQVIRGQEYHEAAQAQHFGGVVLPAKRGEILSRNSKTGESQILATNTTLDLIYVDPLITDNPTLIAEFLADILLTKEFHDACKAGLDTCPRELIKFYASAFDPVDDLARAQSGVLLEPIPVGGLPAGQAGIVPSNLPDHTEARRLFARDIERRISENRVTFVPLVYSATKTQMKEIRELDIPGITVDEQQKLIFANPEEMEQTRLDAVARRLAKPLQREQRELRQLLRSRPLRYVPVMRRLLPKLSFLVKEHQVKSLRETIVKRRTAATRDAAEKIIDPLRSIALIPEHWRFYPDTTLASHVVGFLNTNQEPQYGIERTFNPQLRGQEGLISTVSDPHGGQILTADQQIIDPKDGDSIVLTIDRSIQKEVEGILERAMERYKADSAQAIIMDPFTGRILAMVNTPLFDSNNYAEVYEKAPIEIDAEARRRIVSEIYHPVSNVRVVIGYLDDIFAPDGRARLSEKTRATLDEIEKDYDLRDYTRYYRYIGETLRREIFPTDTPNVWLMYRNLIGVGAYLNRSIQEIYEPGSVMKPVTMAIAIDQGELIPSDTYDDFKDVEVDEYTIRNALLVNYGTVTMTNCLEFSINTCMTYVSSKLGPKLFHRMLERFGFSHITGIELDDELPGELLPWRRWSETQLATISFGQGISGTPLQMIVASAALANGGKLIKPTIIDSVIHPDGTILQSETTIIDQVITQETSETMTAMLVSSVNKGYAQPAKVPGYRIAGKTGTSQIARPGGGYQTGTGSTIASFIGYAPVSHPRFIVLVKFDRPKQGIHGASTAAPIFKEIAAYLFQYYGIPPDER